MKVSTINCITAFSIALVYVYLSPVSGAIPRPPIHGLRGFNRVTNAFRGYGGYGRNVEYVQVPVIKKVTHHHIHHLRVVPKDAGKLKLGTEVGAGYDGGFKGSIGHGGQGNGGLEEKGGYTAVNKRGGRFGGGVLITSFPGHNNGGQAGKDDGHGKAMNGGIEGFIGDTKAEFVPVVIGLLDDEVKDSPLKNENAAYNGFGNNFGQNGDFGGGFGSELEGFGSSAIGKGFGDKSYGQGNRGYSSRKGLLNTFSSKPEYIPPKETIRMFQELTRLGW